MVFQESGYVFTTPEKFGIFFLRLDLSSTLSRQESGTLRKPSSNRKNWKIPTFCFRVDVKHLENDDDVTIITRFSSNTNANWPVIVVFLNSSSIGRTENSLFVFRVKASFSNSSSAVWTVLKFDVVLLSSVKSISWALQLMFSGSTPGANDLYEHVCVCPCTKWTSCGYF